MQSILQGAQQTIIMGVTLCPTGLFAEVTFGTYFVLLGILITMTYNFSTPQHPGARHQNSTMIGQDIG